MVKLSAFGDIIHALPAVEDLAAQAEVHWLVDARFAFLAPVLPQGVHVHPVPLKDAPAKTLGVLWRLRRMRFDLIVDLQGLVKSAIAARIVGAPIFGFDARLIREKPAAWLERPVRFFPEETHVVQQYRTIVAEAMGGPRPASYRPPRIARAFGPPPYEPPYTVLALTGGWATKQWPLAHWQALAKTLSARGARAVALWGNAHEKKRAEALGDAAIVPEARLAMEKLAALLQHAACVIGADTGILHLAAALGAPTITLWGPSSAARAGPQGAQHAHITTSAPCSPCFRRQCDNFICMEAITPEMVVRTWEGLCAH